MTKVIKNIEQKIQTLENEIDNFRPDTSSRVNFDYSLNIFKWLCMRVQQLKKMHNL